MAPFADAVKWEHLPFPKSLPQFQKLFPDDAACAAYLERVRWPKEFICPLCQAKGEPYRFTARPHVLRCRACRQDTALTAGTVMERTRTESKGYDLFLSRKRFRELCAEWDALP